MVSHKVTVSWFLIARVRNQQTFSPNAVQKLVDFNDLMYTALYVIHVDFALCKCK